MLILCYILNTILSVFAKFCREHITFKATVELLCVSEQHSGVSFLNESTFWTNCVNQWFNSQFIKWAVYFIPEWISRCINCCIKSHLNLWYSGQNQYSCNIALAACVILLIIWYKYETKTHTGAFFAPLSRILGHNCIYGVVALHYICQQSTVWNERWRTGLGAGPVR